MKAPRSNKQEVRQAYAIFTPEPEGGFMVTFPEFPGCITYGETYEDARAMGKEVLELWLEELASTDELWPEAGAEPAIVAIQAHTPKQKRRAATARQAHYSYS